MDKDAYPSNTHSSRSVEPEEPPKVEKIVTSGVRQRKKPLGARFKETFGGGDARDAAMYVVLELLMPAAKNAIADAASQWIERMIFPNGSPSQQSRMNPRPSSSNGYVNYSRYSANDRPSFREDPRRSHHEPAIKREFDDIIMSSRVEAMMVLDRLKQLAKEYGAVSVSDLYRMVDITSPWTLVNLGWYEEDLYDAKIRMLSGRNVGYLLDLPKPKALK